MLIRDLVFDRQPVLRHTENGSPYFGMERCGVPRLPDNFLEVAFYLYPSMDAAKIGEHLGGTGFVVLKPFERIQEFGALCFVTNKHVIQRGHTFVRINRRDGQVPDIFHVDEVEWFPHPGPHDVTVALGCGSEHIHSFRCVHYWQLMTRTMAKDEYDIGIGDDVFMIGRFIGHDGKTHNRPSLRFGNISMDAMGIYNHEAGYEEESYAVEMKSKPGYSGSVVFVYKLQFSTTRKSKYNEFCLCLGINWGHIIEKRLSLDAATNKPVEPRQYVEDPTDMSGVIPSWHIKDLLDSREVMEGIRGIEEKTRESIATERVSVKPTSAGAPPAPDENPNHLEDFSRLVDAAARKRPRDDQS
jgi:hypothetical protein